MKKIKLLKIILSILVSILLLPNNTYAANYRDVYLSKDKNMEIEEFINKNIESGKIPGLSVTVVMDDKTIYQNGFGYSDIDEEIVVDGGTLFELGSNSKAFTALGILYLQKEGYINIEDDVSKYIPWFKVKYKGNEVAITIEQLLYHTSGIPFKTIDSIPISNDDTALKETVEKLIGIELDSKPGVNYQYATINYDVLGLIIEQVSGKSYESYIEENVLKPMGLSRTYLNKDEHVIENLSKGYKIQFLNPHEYDAPIYRGNKPAGYIMSCGDDMAKWLKIQMGTLKDLKFDYKIIQDSHEANRKIGPLEDGSSYASGWFVYQKEGGEIAHGGNNPNYSSFIIFKPETKIGVAVLCNVNSYYTQKIGQGILNLLQGENYNKEIKDFNISADKIAILITCLSTFMLIYIIFSMINVLLDIIRGKRFFVKKTKKNILKLIFSFVFMILVSVCIFLMPYILYNGISWKFVFVWMPESLKVALYLTYLCIWCVYLYSIITSFYKKKGDKSLFLITVLSIASGFGNALIIFTINMAINSSNNVKIKLCIYFVFGVMLYVYGQKIVRSKLIDITNEIVYTKRMEVVRYLLRAPFKKFEEIEKGRIESTLNNDTETVSRFANIVITGATSAVTLIFCFIYLGFINIYALLLSVTIILFIASIYYFVGKYANKLGEESRNLQNVFFKFINELIGGFKELSLNQKKRDEYQQDMEISCDKYRLKRGKSAMAFANMFVIGELLFTLAIGTIAILFPLVLKNLEIVDITSYVFILLYMTGPVHSILDTIPNIIEVKIAVKRINSLLETLSNSEEQSASEIELYDKSGINLKLNDIEYVYEQNNENGFKIGPIRCEFNSGEITYITGGNGSGKSTLAKLITGLYQPIKGYITINNIKISYKELNEHYSTVFSDFHLFDKLYGIDYKDKESEIKKYLVLLQLDKKVEIKDGEISTTKLSTGQKKRLALLINYLEDRPIYLFDEWAADQDPEFRTFFYHTLLPELKGRGKCVIVITHDDHYFNLADKFIKMEMGKCEVVRMT